MNIVFIASSAWPAIGGVERHIQELTSEIIADGHNVTLLAPGQTPWKRPDATDKKGSTRIVLWTAKSKPLSNLITAISLGTYLPILLRADIIHYHDYQPLWRWGLWLHPILRCVGKQIHITFHGWEGRFPPSQTVKIKRRFISAIVDSSMAIGHYISTWYGTNSALISYGGVHRPLDEPKCGDYALFVGRLEHDTGILQYLTAFAQAHKGAPHLRLIVCGEGSLKTQAESLARRLHIDATFAGTVPNPMPYYRDARMVFASSYLSILEAFAYGKSVIATYDNPLKQDYLRQMPNSDQMMWICDNISELSATIQAIYATPINHRSTRAHAFALENNWNHVKQTYYRLWGMS